jgi:hypothetical protein
MKDKAKYIDINKVTIPRSFFNQDLNVPKLLEWLDSQPEADVVEVVRCKDCEHFLKEASKVYNGHFCEVWVDYISPDCFCSYGKRKEDMNNV